MKPPTNLYFLHAVSPLHVGVGEGLGAINLPIARERMTGYPYLPGSSIKGVLREAGELASSPDDPNVLTPFGPPTERAADARGGLVFSDASLLCLPVRSLVGTFAWVTAPVVLAHLRRDAAEAGLIVPGLDGLTYDSEEAILTSESALLMKDRLYLEDLLIEKFRRDSQGATQCAGWLAERIWPLPAQKGPEQDLARRAQAFFRARFLIVQNDLFSFLSRTAVEVRSRVKIDDDTGTAAQSGPWQEEALPAETLLHGLIIARSTRLFRIERDKQRKIVPRAEGDMGEPRTAEQALQAFRGLGIDRPGATLRFGGKSGIGMGRARFQVVAS